MLNNQKQASKSHSHQPPYRNGHEVTPMSSQQGTILNDTHDGFGNAFPDKHEGNKKYPDVIEEKMQPAF